MTDHQPFPSWFSSRLPQAAECSLGHTLMMLAAQNPETPFVVNEDGSAVSRSAFRDLALATAGRIAEMGVTRGDRVLVWLPNGAGMLRTIFALSMLGATIVPLNTSLRGTILFNLIAGADAEIMICHPDLLERLDSPDLGRLHTVVVHGRSEVASGTLRLIVEDTIATRPIVPVLNDPWDIAAIIYSSGTTGPSKGVRVPVGQLWTLARVFYGYMGADDRMLLMYPLFHIAGFSAIYGALIAGASLALTEGFRASLFWDLLRTTRSTTTPGLGPTFISILEKPEPKPADASNPLRHVNVQALTSAARTFATRFGCDIMAAYSMTETSGICVSDVNDARDGIVGRPRDGLQVRIVDAHDIEQPVGEAGEIIVRSDLPWTLNAGYHANSPATEAAWRNGWFHTGDIAVRDAAGNLTFVDRKKDVIRRRSENISSSEVEAEVRMFPAVQDAAAVGVIAGGEEEVLVVVTAVEGSSISPKALIEFLIPRMPHHMVPRFVRIVPELPKTHTNRVQKEMLRQSGLTADCWDRELAGIRLQGQRLGPSRRSR